MAAQLKLALILFVLLNKGEAVKGCTNIKFRRPVNESGVHARELQRYIYLATGDLPSITEVNNKELNDHVPSGCFSILLEVDPLSLPIDSSFSLSKSGINGKSLVDLLYGVYHFIEVVTPIRFALHGDLLPDRTSTTHAELNFEDLGNEPRLYSPRNVTMRGLQPFHDFAQGPDWWTKNDYKAFFHNGAKLKLNFMGFHNYGSPFKHPLVWSGTSDQFDEQGVVNNPASGNYENTCSGGVWGGTPKNTSDYLFGSHRLYEADCYDGWEDPEEQNYNSVARFFKDVFTFGRDVFGFEIGVGIEALDELPAGGETNATATDLYRGTFERIMRSYPIDLFWIWTPEAWVPRNDATIDVTDEQVQSFVEDMLAAREAWEALGGGEMFKLGTCGWTLGPKVDRSYFDKVLPDDIILSSINEAVGNANVQTEYSDVRRKDKWSIPWLEDDPGMNLVQLFVNRTIEFGRDAIETGGVNGLMGIHWRTAMIYPTITALARTGWSKDVTAESIWREVVVAEFGLIEERAEESQIIDSLVDVFVSIDSYDDGFLPPPGGGEEQEQKREWMRIPRPASWGPGLIDTCYVYREDDFTFVDIFSSIRQHLVEFKKGPLNLRNFDKWSAMFSYTKSMGLAADLWRQIMLANSYENTSIEELKDMRSRIVAYLEDMTMQNLQFITNSGELGVLTNNNQLGMLQILDTTEYVVKGKEIQNGGNCKPSSPVGCFDSHGRELDHTAVNGASDGDLPENISEYSYMTPEFCGFLCLGAFGTDFVYSGVEGINGDQCRCGKELPTKEIDMKLCDVPCPNGGEGNFCGGDWAMLVTRMDCKDGSPFPEATRENGKLDETIGYRGDAVIVPFNPRTLVLREEKSYEVKFRVVIEEEFSEYLQPQALVRLGLGSTQAEFVERGVIKRLKEGRDVFQFSMEMDTRDNLEAFEFYFSIDGHADWPPGGSVNALTVIVI